MKKDEKRLEFRRIEPFCLFLDEQNGESCHHNADHRHQFNEDVKGWTRGIFEGVTNGVAHDGSLVSERALATKVAFLDHLLGIIPRTAGIGHEYGEGEATGESANEQTKDTSNTQDATNDDGNSDSEE